MNKAMVAIAITSAVAIVGCVSVESIKGQMAVDKPGAEATILCVAKTRHDPNGFQSFTPEQCIELAELLDDSKKCELIKELARPKDDQYYPSDGDMAVLLGLLQKVDGSTATAATAEMGKPMDGKKHTARGAKMEGSNVSVDTEAYAIQVIRAVANSKAATKEKVQAQINRIIGTIKDKNALLSITHMQYADYKVQRYLIPAQFAKILTDQNDLCDFLTGKFDGCTHEQEVENAALAKITDQKVLMKLLADNRLQDRALEKLSDENSLTDFVMSVEDDNWQATMSEAGAKAVKKINDPASLVKISLLAKNSYIAGKAKEKIGADDFIKGFVAFLKEGKLTDKKAISIVNGLKDNQGTIEMYDAAKAEAVKGSVFAKLKTSDRASIRARNKGECEKKIAAAKAKGKDTFELGGFYLGMDIADVDMLIGYYFPEWSNNQDFEDDEKEVRAIWVPNQKTAFCRAGKDGKVYELNFGKTILKKWYKYDVQRFTDWADKYAAENKIDMPAVLVKRDVTVQEPMSPSSYEIWYRQQSHQYKNNVKGYRLTYFTEDANYFSGHGGVAGNVLKGLAADRVRYIRGDAGMLKARVERD